MYCLKRKTLKGNSLVQKICMFFQKETSHCKSSLELGPQGPKQYIFRDHFYSENAWKVRFHAFLLFYVKNIWNHNFTWSRTNSQEIVNFVSIVGPHPLDTGRKLNVHKTFRRCPGRFMNVLRTFNLRPVSTWQGPELSWNKFTTSCKFSSLQVKWWCHMFSSIKN